MVQKLNQKSLKTLEKGGKVLLTIKKGAVKEDQGGNVGIGFSSIFWNTAWTGGQKPHTLGILCNPDHKAFEEFPTEYHSNWQWWDAMTHSNAISLENLPDDIVPITRVIDDWVSNRRLALIFEIKVGKGKHFFKGVSIINPKLLEYLPQNKESSLIDQAIIPAMSDGHIINCYLHSGYWNDVGTFEGLKRAEKDLNLNSHIIPSCTQSET